MLRDPPNDEDRKKGIEVLRLILTHGLLCTPERFNLFPNYNTANKKKREFLLAHKPHDQITQSRACFTLVDTLELSKEYQLSQDRPDRYVAHTDLFGEFAVGLDPMDARALGLLPTVYYYRHDITDRRGTTYKTAGLGGQILERLDEVRVLFSILSHIEAKAHASPEEKLNMQHPPSSFLNSIGIEPRYESAIQSKIEKLTQEQASFIFDLFDSDRVPAWNIVDFVKMMLSLYQTTDSTIEDAPLAFFQQREWRLVHHMMVSLRWFGLGAHPASRNPYAGDFVSSIREIKTFLLAAARQKRPPPQTKAEKEAEEQYWNWFFDNSWVLAGTDERPFRDFVREIVVPADCYVEAKKLADSLPFASPRPILTRLPPKWRILTKDGTPQIVQAAKP